MVNFDFRLDFDIGRAQRDHHKVLMGTTGIEPRMPAWLLAVLGYLSLGFDAEQGSFWVSLLN